MIDTAKKTRKLIVNADDFGYTSSVNKGIIEAYKNGIVTSTSLMVKREAAKEAAKLAKENPGLGVGFHFELTQEQNMILHQLKKALNILQLERTKEEFYRQLEMFKKLMSSMPTHIDGHHHVHKLPGILPFLLEFSQKYKIPLRAVGKINFIDTFSTDPKDTQSRSVENLTKILKTLPDGISELMTHPSYNSEELRRISSLNFEREIELQTLTLPEIKKVTKEENVQLISWRDVNFLSLK